MMRLQSLFLSVLNMGITAGWLTLTLLLLRPLLRGFPRVFSYLLWLVVYIRLLCPVSFTWAASLLGLLDRGKNASIPLTAMGTPRGAMPASFIDWAMTARGETPLPLPVLSLLWFAGTVVMLLYGLFSYYKLRKAVHGAQPAGDGIYRCHTVDIPFILGIFHPAIYLPDSVEGEAYDYILQHEQIHLRRRDYIIKPVAYLALCLHWYNPLVWLSFRLMTRDMEMSCDETVLYRMGASIKKSYSNSLLQMAAKKQSYSLHRLAFGETDTKRRITNVLKYKRPMGKKMAIAICLVTAISLAMLANPKAVVRANSMVPEPEVVPTITVASTSTEAQAPTSEAAPVVIPLYGQEGSIALRYIFSSGGYLAAGIDSYLGHTGADFAAPANTSIYAAQSGTVAYVSHEIIWPMGRSLIIDHGEGWQTLYAHCSQVLLEEGDTVAQGDLIAKVGCTGNATGNHCHFELRYRGEVADPLDYLVGWDKKANRMTLE